MTINVKNLHLVVGPIFVGSEQFLYMKQKIALENVIQCNAII